MKKVWIITIAVLSIAVLAISAGAVIATNGSGGEAQERESEENEAQIPASQAKITARQAKDTALAVNPGVTITEVELEKELGTLAWEVEFSNGVEVSVDAESGRILNMGHEPNDTEERNEAGTK